MRNVSLLAGGLCVTLLCGCVGGGRTAFETYPTGDTGFNRVRMDRSTEADAAVIAAFDDDNPADPAGYRNLIALSDEHYAGNMTIEVIAAVEGSGSSEQVTRVLRLTADQSPFENEQAGGSLVTETGKYYLRGQNFVWVSIDGEPLLSANGSGGGNADVILDFDRETATLQLRTGVSDTSTVRTEIVAENLPFNIRSGAYGGDITVQVWDPDSSAIFAIDGILRGNVGGTPAFADGTHGMTTSGLYTANGTDGPTRVTLDGVFVGTDPNALP